MAAAVTDGRIPFNSPSAPSDKKAEPFGSALAIIHIINPDYSAMETS